VNGLSTGVLAELESVVSVASRATDRLAAAHDASHYLLTPQAVATPGNEQEVAAIFEVAVKESLPVTFRSGGTSLSGQAGSQGLLIDTRKHFREIEVLDDGARVRTGPGATVRAVNIRLARHGRKLGPDPASEIACTIGGVVANNSSGMACGVIQNTYRTLDSAVLVLPTGTVVDTSREDADALLREREPAVHAGLLRLRDRVRADPESVATLERLHSIKNTMGYGLNSFLDFDDPVEILEHLVVGSEGTLAFVAEATFRTVPLKTQLATALLYFENLEEAATAVPQLVDAGFATVELLDATSLRVAQGDPEAPDELLAMQIVDHAALLVELQEESADALARSITKASVVLARLPLVTPGALSTDANLRAQLWHIRKGLYTLVAGARPAGTTALLEDIAVPVPMLAATCAALGDLFDAHGYEDTVIFGHAKDGNVHFMLNERFDDPQSLARYEAFTLEMVELVLANGGTLKAEHGTGRIMAPFVQRQYGDELYAIMRELKSIIDPHGILNPGVLLSDDAQAHLRNLKTAPRVEEEVDRCVECGYCEPGCPSKDLTLTPRERIVLRRELQRAREAGDVALVAELEQEYRYDGIETCAVDGMCQVACPVLINTGDLVRRLRSETQSRPEQAAWRTAAGHWDAVSRVGGLALTVTNKIPAAIPVLATKVGRSVLGDEVVPLYSADLPAGGRRRAIRHDDAPVAVYFSSCTTTMFGPAAEGGGVAESFLALCERAGVRIRTPDDLPSLCCGTPWKSKGLTAGYAEMKARVAESLRLATGGGRLPVVCDASSCSEGLEVLLEAAGEQGIRVIDAVAFVAESVLPHLSIDTMLASLVLHPTCSSKRLGLDEPLMQLAESIAQRVEIPEDWGCCAFAGDRGMLHPELTASATEPEARAVGLLGEAAHASLNRTCELGMTRATGQPYQHILELLDRASGR
jgi:D-lactate dehydrogenase